MYDQPALSPLDEISFIVLLNTPYKWIICSDICCMQIGGVDCIHQAIKIEQVYNRLNAIII